MNADVTAENRPACCLVSARRPNSDKTHEDETDIQILIVLFHELLVVFRGLLVIGRVEFTPRILSSEVDLLHELIVVLLSRLAICLVEFTPRILSSGVDTLFPAAR